MRREERSLGRALVLAAVLASTGAPAAEATDDPNSLTGPCFGALTVLSADPVVVSSSRSPRASSVDAATSSFIEAGPENTETETYAPGTSAVFETAALPERLEVTGQPVLDVWVSRDRPDAHLAAKLEVFGPDGAQLPQGRVTGLRSRQHLQPLVDNRFQQETSALPPVGVPLRVALRFQATDLVVPKGGRIRPTLAGSVIVFEGLDQTQKGAGVLFRGPSQPSGTATRVTIHHDCAHPSAVRVLMPRKRPDLNVREKDEPADQPLADNRPFAAPVSDAGGPATAPICGRDPIDPQSVGAAAKHDYQRLPQARRHVTRAAGGGALRLGLTAKPWRGASVVPTGGAPQDGVMEKRTLEAHLTIEFDDDRISGEVRDARGVISTFAGWLDLLSALDALAKPRSPNNCVQAATRAQTTF